MAVKPYHFLMPDGNIFVPTSREVAEASAFPMGIHSEDELRSAVSGLWSIAYEAKRPEHDRMSRCSKYWDGLHYEMAEENLANEITNFPFSVVETVWPELVEAKPRPEVVPGKGMTDQTARDIQDLATWYMNTAGFDRSWRLSRREMLKLGWCAQIISFDSNTGMPYPKPWNNWDFYEDPAAAHEDSMMWCFLAAPISTALLRRTYPEKAHLIQPDGWASPSYDALVRPWRDMMSARSQAAPMMAGAGYEERGYDHTGPNWGTPTAGSPSGGEVMMAPAGGITLPLNTTFTWQFIFRDLRTVRAVYTGKILRRTGEWHWGTLPREEQYCSSGWSMATITSNGTVLDIAAVDPCYWGLPLVIGRDYEHAFRFWSMGEIDQIIPPTRGYNHRNALMTTALEYQSNAVLVYDNDSGIDLKRIVDPGSALKKNRGSSVDWLTFHGPNEGQFMLQQASSQNIDIVSGVHDTQQGERAPGLQTGRAIERLQTAAKTRIRGKEGGLFDEQRLLLKKCLNCLGMKSKRRILFRATDGSIKTVDPEILLNEYDVEFVPGTGLGNARERRKDEAMALYSAGAIDQQELLKSFDWKNSGEIMQRMALAAKSLANDDDTDEDGGAQQ